MNFMRTITFALACLIWAGGAFAQGKWTKLAAFPEAAEELLGASAGGKVYVFCGLAPRGTPIGMVYEYDPATDKWTKKKPMPLASHHVSFTEYKGKIYAFGGFVLPQSGPAAWVPIDNAWEYDPATDNWKDLAPLPTKRGSPVAVTVGDRMVVIGGATTLPGSTAVHPARPHYSVGSVEEYDPSANTWRARAPIPTPRNHATAGVVNGKVYVIGGRMGSAARAHAFGAQRDVLGNLGRKDLRHRRRGAGLRGDVRFPGARSVRPRGEQLDGPPQHACRAPRTRRRHRRQPTAYGERRRAVGGHRRAGPHRFARRVRGGRREEVMCHGAVSARSTRFAVAGWVEK